MRCSDVISSPDRDLGGAVELWAFAYDDAIDIDTPTEVVPVDVVATSALHPALSHSHLAFFVNEHDRLAEWLEPIPVGVTLQQLDRHVVAHICSLSQIEGVSVELLSKVLHRKRPDAIPLIDRHVVDLYRRATGERTATAAFPGIVHAMKDDLAAGTALPLAMMQLALEKQTGVTASMLRLADIGVWMTTHHPSAGTLATKMVRP